ncbi:MAG: D-aminoacyl-tRNA deacylase [Polyangiaceae bacterium]
MQRALAASVSVDSNVVGAIDRGLVAFVGAQAGDTDDDLDYVVRKIVELRVFEDERGKMARALADVGGGLLLISQFTLFGDVRRGNRPSFDLAMPPLEAKPAFERFVEKVRARVPAVQTGIFAADMRVSVENDGPVTILLDSRAR